MNISELQIGLVGPLPPPSGGMANQTMQLAKLLRQEGAQICLIQVNSPYHPDWIKKVRGIRALFRLIPYLIKLWRSANSVQLFHVMANSGWSWHLYAAPAIWIAKIKKKYVVINYRGGEAEAFLNKSLFWIRLSLGLADAIIVPSGFLEEIFKKKGFSPIIVPNIVNLDLFSEPAHKNSQENEKSPHIILTRNLEAIYDNATAITAFYHVRKVFPHARLTVAGTGPEQSALTALVNKLGIADGVTFTGRIENEAIADLYRNADIMVNPSLIDNMPISILEALASGVPVVSTNVGGIPYMVNHDKTAMLVPPKDPIAMSNAILTLLNDPDKARKITQAGLDAVAQYSWHNVKNRLLSVYQQILTKSLLVKE